MRVLVSVVVLGSCVFTLASATAGDRAFPNFDGTYNGYWEIQGHPSNPQVAGKQTVPLTFTVHGTQISGGGLSGTIDQTPHENVGYTGSPTTSFASVNVDFFG